MKKSSTKLLGAKDFLKLAIPMLMAIMITFVFLPLASATGQKEEMIAPKKTIIKLSHSHRPDPKSSELEAAALVFQDYVNKNSDTLEVKIYPNNELGEEREVYEGIQLGSGATCVISGTAILNNFDQKIGVLDLPFLWKGYDHVNKVLDGEVGNILAKELEKKGFKVLAWMDSWGFRNVVTSKKEVKTPEDLKGLKIRTIQTPVYVAALNAMGCNATPMPFGQVYTAMQTGVLDGFEHGAAVIKAQKFYEVAKYIALTRHLFGPLVFVYSLKEWNKLTDNEKQIIMEGAKKARDQERRLAPIRVKEAFDFLKSKGMVINKIDTSSFEKKAIPLQDEIAAKRGATKLLQMIRAAAPQDN